MRISQSLPKPENWQTFESLCKKLWGEIWDCPEIKKNGRSGQKQHGVDIYGIPNGQVSYFGIQCKGKDENTGKNLTEKEIYEEIEKAKNFEPKLKKLYFTTTANKDAFIEEVVRKINVGHIQKGFFEVHLYSWEDIVDLIFENKTTYDYYLNSNSFKTKQSVKVTFRNGQSTITVSPEYIKKSRVAKSKYEAMERETDKYFPKIFTEMQNDLYRNYGMLDFSLSPVKKSKIFNRSLVDATIVVTNDGSEPLEHWKLVLTLPEQISEATHKNFEKKGYAFIHNINIPAFDTYIDEEKHIIEIEPRQKILVGDDSFVSDPLFLKPIPEESVIEIDWKLVSKNFKQEGVLALKVEPKINQKRIKVDDDSPLLLDERDRVTTEDYFETIED